MDEQEVISLALLCLWHGSERGIAFFAFNKMMYHLVTRCCESAGLWKKEIQVVNKTSRLLTNSILEFDLTRTKTKTSQQSVVYPHKNNFLWDLYFGLGLHFAVESDPKDTLFPNFFKKLSKEKNLKKETTTSLKQQNCGINTTKNSLIYQISIKVSFL